MKHYKTIQAYTVHKNSVVTGRHWIEVFDAYGRIVYSVHSGKVYRSSLFYPQSSAGDGMITPADLKNRIVYPEEADVACIPDPPPHRDPEFDEALHLALFRPAWADYMELITVPQLSKDCI